MVIKSLSTNIVIENVLQIKIRGRVAYQGILPSQTAINVTYSKLYNDPSGKGYQRPVDKKRSLDFAEYLSQGEDALYTPILINAGGEWHFDSYDNLKPNYGRLICKSKGSLMDGQHRLYGIKEYVNETNSNLSIPFLAFHFIEEDEEIKLFDVINTKAKGIGTSLSRYLNRNNDDLSWIATNLILSSESPFYNLGTITGKRNKEKRITLQNLYVIVKTLSKKSDVEKFSKEKLLNVSIHYFSIIKEMFYEEWLDSHKYRITHITCLNALAIVGKELIIKNLIEGTQQINWEAIKENLKVLKKFDWYSNGELKYLKGMGGSKILANEILYAIKNI